MDPILVMALVSFGGLVLSWLALPNGVVADRLDQQATGTVQSAEVKAA